MNEAYGMRISEGEADVMQSPRLLLKRVLAGALWIAWLGAAAAAAGPDDLLGPPARVSVTANAEPTPAGWTVRLTVTPVKGVHVYSPGNEGYIGVSIALDLPSGLKSRDARFPQGDPYMFGALKEVVTVYEKPFEIRQDVVRTGKGPEKLPVTVSGTLRYQACTDKICFPPQEHSFEVTLEQSATRSSHR